MTVSHHRPPIGRGRSPIHDISDAGTALATVATCMHRPARAETIALMLAPDRVLRTAVVVSGTEQPDSAVDVVDFLSDTAEGLHALVVGSVRPPGAPATDPELRSDVDRWLEMSDLAEQRGVELVEWFVIGRRIVCPRDELGAPPRW